MNPSLTTLCQRGTEFLGSRHAIMGGAMSWVSESTLVAALSNAGAFGVIACSAMPPPLLAQEIEKTKAKTSRPFGVNLIIMHPELEALVAVCAAQYISHVVFAGGIPKLSAIEAVKAYGGKVFCFAPTASIGKKLIKMGADALIIEGTEAGGHIGPVSTSVLAQEILPQIRDVPVFVAGGIGRGEAMVSYMEMGAAGVQLGTRFVCAKESIAHPKFKEAFIRANARDAMPSVQFDREFSVIPVRALANKATDDFMRLQREVALQYRSGALDKKEAQLKIENFWAGALRRAVIDGDVEYGSVMAGQSVGMVTSIQSAQDIVDELMIQASGFLSRNAA